MKVIAARTSDDKPLWVQFLQGKGRPSKCFKFEACWNEDEKSAGVIKNEWEKDIVGENPLSLIAQKMERCAASLSSWNMNKYGNTSKRLTSLTKKFEAMQTDQRVNDRDEIKALQEEINILLEMEDIKWRQRAKRRRSNTIQVLPCMGYSKKT
jgi:hypothetical protein